jgi:hypothetical protein
MSATRNGKETSSHRGSRRSACATASRARELERLRHLSIAARIDEALSMGRRFSWLKPAPKGD